MDNTLSASESTTEITVRLPEDLMRTLAPAAHWIVACSKRWHSIMSLDELDRERRELERLGL